MTDQFIKITLKVIRKRGSPPLSSSMSEAFHKMHEDSTEKFGLVWYETHEKMVTYLRQWGIPVDNFFVRYLCTLAIYLALETYQGENPK